MKDFFAAGGEFLAMGGYAFFVWGSYAVSAALIALEVVLLARRHKKALRKGS
ncbi:MAG TPA: heme exporter protein CcmD [Burkholderiales bacterium]|nr:heme exporter protein CcmD [Burkholderiales bacterium]